MKKIKIAQIITRMDWAGSPDIVRIICTSLDKERYDVRLIMGLTRYPTDNTKMFLEEFRDNIITIPWLRRDINPFFDCLALIKLYYILRKERFDIVHTHTAKAGALGRLAAYFAGNRRIIHMAHGHNFYGYFNFFISKSIILIERFLSKFTTRFIALSELEKKDLIRFGVAEEDKVKVVPSGIDLRFKNIDRNKTQDKKRELGFDINQKIVGMVSRLEQVKGPAYFIEAAEKIAKRVNDVQFLIVGEGSLRKILERRVKEMSLDGRIKFIGWRKDALEIISFLDILVQPSLNEAVGRVLLEAQGLGVVVVATKVGGIPEIVKDNITGILISPRDSEGLAMAIYELLQDEERRINMSRNAKEWIGKNFSEQVMLEGIVSIYRQIALV